MPVGSLVSKHLEEPLTFSSAQITVIITIQSDMHHDGAERKSLYPLLQQKVVLQL